MTLEDFSDPPPIVHTTGPRWSHSVAKLAEALAKAQAEMGGAAKDAVNPHFRSKYADLASVRDACRPLAKYGIAHLQPTRAEGAQVTVTTLLVHSSGEWIAEDLTLTAGQNTPQAIGSAITYGRRYGLAAMVGIAPEDDDGEAAEARGVPKPSAVTAPPPPPPPGFAAWWDDLQAVVDEGPAALQAAWNKSPADLRKYLTTTTPHKEQWAKIRAAQPKGPAA